MPGLRHDPGRGAGYPVGRCAMQFVVHHDTGGTNSYWVCKDGRPGYETGLCQILLPKVGVPWQFSEIDSVAYHCGSSADYDRDGDADNYNRTGPGLEVERLQGEPLSEDQAHWLGEIGRWLESEWDIPNVQYRGVPLTDADNFHGHVNHRDLHPNPDGLSVAEWAQVTINVQLGPRKDQDVVFLEETGTYWVMGFGDYVELPKSVGIGAALNGAAVVPIKTAERIAMGIAAEKQAKAFFAKVK
jgi:hypothetical protein